MVNTSKETWKKNCVEVIIFESIKWLNENHIER